jgi:hypothetical protein
MRLHPIKTAARGLKIRGVKIELEGCRRAYGVR